MAFQIFGTFMQKQYEQPELPVSSLNGSAYIQIVLAQAPLWILIYIAVFTVYFYMSEYNSGFYKNYLSLPNARRNTVFSKIIILGLFTGLMFISLMIADLIGRGLFFNNTSIGDWGYFSRLIMGQFLLHWAAAVLVLCMTIMIKNTITCIIIGILLSLNVFGMIIGSIEALISDTDLASYLLINTAMTIKDFAKLSDVSHVIAVGLVYLLGFGAVAFFYKQREDLK